MLSAICFKCLFLMEASDTLTLLSGLGRLIRNFLKLKIDMSFLLSCQHFGLFEIVKVG